MVDNGGGSTLNLTIICIGCWGGSLKGRIMDEPQHSNVILLYTKNCVLVSFNCTTLHKNEKRTLNMDAMNNKVNSLQ